MSLIKAVIIVEIFLFVVVFLWVRKLNSKQSRQPSLSKKIIKSLKFQNFDHKIRNIYKKSKFMRKFFSFPSHFVYEMGQNIYIFLKNMVSSVQGLAPITNPLNSVLIEKKLINVDQKFIQLVSLAEGLPRTEVIESGRNYWRGVCLSLIHISEPTRP